MNVRKVSRYLVLMSIHQRRRGHNVSPLTKRLTRKLISYMLLKEHYRTELVVKELAAVRAPRRWHVRPIFQARTVHGAWYSLIPLMRETDRDEYFNFMRMTPESFDDLLEFVAPHITKRSYRESIPPGERLAVTLRYLASGDPMTSLSYLFRIANQTISKIVFETCVVIWFALKDFVFEPLCQEFWQRKAAEFESMWQFPMCIGAMDGKHCAVQKFALRGSENYCYKHFDSVVLLAVTDAKYKFIVVDVGAKGREHDAGVFSRSDFGEMFRNHQLELPQPVFREEIQTSVPYVFIGDDAFPFDVHLMKAFDEKIVERQEEIIFNYRFTRARRVVENSFGILSARFRVLRTKIIGNEVLVQTIILATTALHNMHLNREDSLPPQKKVYLPPGYADTYRSNGTLKKGRWRDESEEEEEEEEIFRKLAAQEMPGANVGTALIVREKFMDFFVAKPLSWQWGHLL